MANKQQTAVQILVEQVGMGTFGDHIKGTLYWDQDTLLEMLEKALKMEQEQKINDYNEGVESEYQYHINSEPRITAEQYYNQNYSLPDAQPE